MQVSKEAIKGIVDFSVGKKKPDGMRKSEILGEIEHGCDLVYGVFSYQIRAVSLPGQPRVLGWTRQRVLALVTKEHVTPLAYEADVLEIREDLVIKIVNRLKVIQARYI